MTLETPQEEKNNPISKNNESIVSAKTNITETLQQNKRNLSNTQYVEYLQLGKDMNSDNPSSEYDHFSPEYDEEAVTRRELRYEYLIYFSNNCTPREARQLTISDMHEKPYANISID